MEDKNQYYSRSTLATKLAVTLKELTHTLIEAGWLEHKGDNKQKEWYLTNKGKFEGGIYRESKKFGKYIVWPQSIFSHDVIKSLQKTTINVSKISASFDISPIILNKLLSDLGWIVASDKGWNITEPGTKNGAIQQTSDETGIPYVVWSRKIQDSKVLQAHVGSYKGDTGFILQREVSGARFFRLLNGLWVDHMSDLLIGNYLYICGVSFAYQRLINSDDHNSIEVDFYLPGAGITILVNRDNINPTELNQQIEKQSVVEKCGFLNINITSAEIASLDKSLPKLLLPLGLSLY
jgi:hypothetical protein